MTPSSCGHPRIRACQVRLGDLEVDHRLPLGRVLVGYDLLGFVCGNLPQAGSFFCLGVDAVKILTAASAADESVTVFHAIGFNRDIEATKTSTVSE